MESAKDSLKNEVARFRAWREQLPDTQRNNVEALSLYSAWQPLHAAFCALLDTKKPEALNEEIIGSLLYCLACDEEAETLKDALIRRPDHLLHLAARGYADKEEPLASGARWQLADALGHIAPNEGIDALLEKFFRDDNEYVRRRALLALGARKSPKAEALANEAWESDNEYQRMAVLDVLQAIGSPSLPAFLQRAHEDGRAHLLHSAEKIKKIT